MKIDDFFSLLWKKKKKKKSTTKNVETTFQDDFPGGRFVGGGDRVEGHTRT